MNMGHRFSLIAVVCAMGLSSQPALAQLSQQGPKLVGTGAVGTALQGYSVALSADGNTAIVGGSSDNSNAGAAWVWTRVGGVWAQQGTKLVGSGASGDAQQGYSVSLSGDGNTAIVGGYSDNSGAGAAWVWTRSGRVWTQQGTKLVGSSVDITGGANQGSSVSLSADGNTAIIGGEHDHYLNGAAWVWTRSGGVWTQQGTKLVDSGAGGIVLQGRSVSLSADGNTAIIGGVGDNGFVGAAWVWTRSGGVWTQQGTKLVGSGAVGNAQQGSSVSLSADGNTAIIGGVNDNVSTGAAWVWTRSGGVWTQQGTKLVGSGASGNAQQGRSVSLSADGNTAIIGGVNDNNGPGAAWAWERNAGAWTQQGTKLVGSGAVGNAQQGSSVSLSADGNTAMVGGFGDNGSTGAAWVFAAGAPQEPNWVLKSPASSPPARSGHAMAYDAARGQVVLFGGNSVNDTWVWDGVNWMQKNPANIPSPRAYPAMAYDAVRRQVVLFGGSGGAVNDTWVWDGTNWTLKNPVNSPPPTSLGYAMAYDAARGQVVLFGGGRTWTWDGLSWAERTGPQTPGADRPYARLAYDGLRDRVVLYGGVAPPGNFNLTDTWTWDGLTWSRADAGGSLPNRWRHAMAFDASAGKVVLFGGGVYNGLATNETWLWDGSTWSKDQGQQVPPPRYDPAMAYDETRREIVLFGGWNSGGSFSDTWVWRGDGGCSFALSPSSLNISSTAFTGYLTVTPSNSNCPWAATAASTGWLQITSGGSGTTAGQIGYRAIANPTTAFRTGTITVGGQVFTVTQEGVQTGVVPFALTATPRCWEGSSAYPAGPGILLEWAALGWPTSYEILRDRQVIATARGTQFYNIVGLTPGRAYSYQVRASNSSSSVLSAQVVAAASWNCTTTSTLRVEDIALVSSTLVSGTSTTGKVRLSAAAPAGGATVLLSSSSANLTVPVSITIPAGQAVGAFAATAANVLAFATATITATLGASSADTSVDLKPTVSSGTGTAYLFLHGLNSDPRTWIDLIDDRDGFGYCEQLSLAKGDGTPFQVGDSKTIWEWDWLNPFRKDKPPNGCYALEFNSSQEVLPGGGDWDSGDGLDYTQLGQQVGAAVEYIVAQRNPSAIVLVGHSRGGLAAREFLQKFQSRDELPYKVGLITIGTPHQGSPFGRVEWWMDRNNYVWTDTLATTTQISALAGSSLVAVGSTIIRAELKFVFSPSVGNLGTSHLSDGTLNLDPNPALKNLNQDAGHLKDVVSAAGQIVSTGMDLGENVLLGCDVFTVSAPCPALAPLLPGSSEELKTYVLENITSGPAAGWNTNTDGVVPAASQRLNNLVEGIPSLEDNTKYLDRIKHTDETGQTACINEVLDSVISQPSLLELGMAVESLSLERLGTTPSVRSVRAGGGEETDPRTSEALGRMRRLNVGDLVETALQGERANSLEGLASRREMRGRDEAGQREIVTQLRQRLARSDQATRAGAVRLLAEVPAEHSAEAVMEVLRTESNAVVRREALRTVRTLAAEAVTPASRRNLSENLRRIVGEPTDVDPETFLASVDGLVALGGAVEVEQLMDLHQRSDEARKQLLAGRMGALRNGEGAQRLAEYLAEDPGLQQEQARLAGEVLSEMSTVESVSGLLEWAVGVETQGQQTEAVRWLKRVRTTRGKARLAEVVQQGEFRSKALQQSLEKVLTDPGQCTATPATPIL